MNKLIPILSVIAISAVAITCNKSSSTNTTSTYPMKRTIDGVFLDNYGNHSFCQAAGNSFVFLARTASYKMYVAKISSGLDMIWEKTYFDQVDNVGGLEALSDGGFVIACNMHDTTGHPWDPYRVKVLKLNAAGEFLWEKNYWFTCFYRESYSIRETYDKGICLTTTYFLKENPNEFLPALFRMDEHGDSLWTVCIPGQKNSMASDLLVTKDHGYLLSGIYFLSKVDSTGEIEWTQKNVPNISCMIHIGNDSIACLGSDHNDHWESEPALAMFDAGGNKVWEKVYSYFDEGVSFSICSLVVSPGGGFAFTSAQYNNIYMTFTDARGNNQTMISLEGYIPAGLTCSGGVYYYYYYWLNPTTHMLNPVIYAFKR